MFMNQRKTASPNCRAVSEFTMVSYLQNLLYYKFLWQVLDTECTVFLIL